MQKPIAAFSNLTALDVRIGTVLSATRAATNKPAYRMVIDFGSEIGLRTSCGAYTNYSADALIGKQASDCYREFRTKEDRTGDF